MLDDWTFCASSQRAGAVVEWSKVLQRNITITPTGDWVPTEDAYEYFEKEYPVWCPAERAVIKRPHVIYKTSPSARQAAAKPTGGF